MRSLALSVMFLLGACYGDGWEGYHSPVALVRLDVESVSDLDTALAAATAAFAARGMEIYPKHQTRVSIHEAGSAYAWREDSTVELWLRRSDYGFSDGDIAIRLIPYPDATKGWCDISLCEAAPTETASLNYPFLQMTVTQLRAGGFSAYGLTVYADALNVLRQSSGTITVVHPPPVNEAEHDRITQNNLAVEARGWLATWLIYMSVIGGLGILMSRRAGVVARRSILAALGVIVVTPLPVSIGFFAFFVPGLFALPRIPHFLSAEPEKLAVAYLASLILSILAGLIFIRRRRSRPQPGTV